MTPCPCHQRQTDHIYPLSTSLLLRSSALETKSLRDFCAAPSASPLSRSTWRCPQKCRRSRGMCLILSCRAARRAITPYSLVLWTVQPYFPHIGTSFPFKPPLLFRCCCGAWDALPFTSQRVHSVSSFSSTDRTLPSRLL